MYFQPTERVGLFIDGPSLHATLDALSLDLDFKRLFGLFQARARLVSATYYAADLDPDTGGTLRPLLNWLDCNGFKTVTKRQRDKVRGSSVRIDIELTVDTMMLANALDHIVIVSGNGCFRHLVAALQETGKRVSVLSTLATRPPMIADGLRRQADHFIDLEDLRNEIAR